MTADAMCNKVLFETDSNVLEAVEFPLEFAKAILESLERHLSLAVLARAFDVVDVFSNKSNQCQLAVTCNMLAHNLHVGLARKVRQGCKNLGEHKVPKSWGVLQAKATTQHIRHLSARVKVLVVVQHAKDRNTTWRNSHLYAALDFAFDLGDFVERQSLEKRL